MLNTLTFELKRHFLVCSHVWTDLQTGIALKNFFSLIPFSLSCLFRPAGAQQLCWQKLEGLSRSFLREWFQMEARMSWGGEILQSFSKGMTARTWRAVKLYCSVSVGGCVENGRDGKKEEEKQIEGQAETKIERKMCLGNKLKFVYWSQKPFSQSSAATVRMSHKRTERNHNSSVFH